MNGKRPILALAFFALSTLAGAEAFACWIQVPLASLVSSADVIVVGKIVAIERAPGESDYEYDSGTIKVREVIKGRDVLEQLAGTARRAPLSFPAETNRLKVSTDLRYEKGQAGVWLLTLRQGRLMAARPDALQPLAKLKEIRERAASRPPETEPPPDQGPRPKIKKRRPLPISVEHVR